LPNDLAFRIATNAAADHDSLDHLHRILGQVSETESGFEYRIDLLKGKSNRSKHDIQLLVQFAYALSRRAFVLFDVFDNDPKHAFEGRANRVNALYLLSSQ
ncbi:MAG: hypothetical protein ACREIA_08345, partial [Opitutaceae bacterium]